MTDSDTPRLVGVGEKLLYAAVMLVPFQQTLTLNVGFPLKMSEVLTALSIPLLLIDSTSSRRRVSGSYVLVGIALLTVISAFANSQPGQIYGTPEAYPRGLTFDLLEYTAYGLFAIAAGWMAANRLTSIQIAKAIAVGAVLTAVVCLLQLGAWSFLGGANAFAWANGAVQTGSSFGPELPRNGPFLEGNYLGFFSGVALYASWHARSKIGVIAAVVCLIYSQSTVGIVATLIGLTVIALLRPSGKFTFAIAALASVGGVVALATNASTFISLQLAKIGLISSTGFSDNVDYSLRFRTVNIETGIDMALAHPITGVGAGRFEAWYNTYFDHTGLPDGFGSQVVRQIANNAYVQMASEHGLIAAALFLAVVFIGWNNVYRKSRALLGLVAFVAVALNATPAWTVLPIWFALAIALTDQSSNTQNGKIETLTSESNGVAETAKSSLHDGPLDQTFHSGRSRSV